jgi:hypothetical protein
MGRGNSDKDGGNDNVSQSGMSKDGGNRNSSLKRGVMNLFSSNKKPKNEHNGSFVKMDQL